MPWMLLIVAGLLEVGWAVGLKHTDGFNFATRPLQCVTTLLLMVGSFWLLSLAVRDLPIGTAYAVWVGIGAVGTAVVGMLVMQEPASLTRALCLLMIVAGIVGLKLATPAVPSPTTPVEIDVPAK